LAAVGLVAISLLGMGAVNHAVALHGCSTDACASKFSLPVGNRETRYSCMPGQLIDGVAAGPPVGKFLVIEALRHMRLPFVANRLDTAPCRLCRMPLQSFVGDKRSPSVRKTR
jgi:hypothetical protein